ncbi:MAG: isopenicillin N synthase family oxygenase [Rhodospirillaceae bacterium]|jgi:isopenicillin N synthase-like dioxygenase|nr:isopenicillin N synthase family oxygenase [Rhodospirillaceae bacterium]MBT5944276.1 isopenicillin N synthase family oxygenase [Rhodospirillaceae bacterium]MBT6405667.1 isopenicillin N synthase family oxygenase [Rhodospirillaceae bacterium]MBT6536070.1 isopenicillin N synthase family oxygenase [Rhodospirillaceae bacterium]MBT7361043.1 isopenicillin N synthase family oxygenase [Rhodospirillaceae bacterium]
MTEINVPVIDIAPYLNGADGVVGQVRDACEGIGFFAITGHGVEPEIIDSLRRTAKSFFARPADEKATVHHADPALPRGYRAIGDEGLAYGSGEETPPDLKEVFHMGPPDFPDTDYFTCDAAAAHFIENVYPGQPADFRAAASSYYRRLETLGQTIEEIFARALDLPDEFFRKYTDRQIGALRIIRYPPLATTPLPGQLRAGTHTDYGTFTLLLSEDRPGGLEVRTREGNWIAVPTPADSFVVNIGDLMMRWTNDRFVSNPHRVAIPPEDAGDNSDRLSVVFFHHPNYDAEITCIPTCTDADNPPKHQPVFSGPYRLSMYTATRLETDD